MPRKIVIAAGIAAQPISAAGNAWLYLHWILGFRALGWDVRVVEAVDSAKCVDTHWKSAPFESSANRAWWNTVLARHGLLEQSTLLVDGQAASLADLQRFAAEADVFLNYSGHFKRSELAFPRAVKVYIDGDPAFTQVWADAYACDMNFAAHDRFFSAGRKLGQPGTLAPTCGIAWEPVFQPVFLPDWPFEPQESFRKFTTVANWHGYPPVEWNGTWFHGKGEEFAKLVDVPRSVPAPIEVATHAADHAVEIEPFRAAGWQFTEARAVCDSMDAFEAYVRGSSAEFSPAKGGYVVSRAGWTSDRTSAYLASGRPAVIQDTGFGSDLPTGEGILTFTNADEAAAACRAVLADFPAHQRAARRIAEQYLATDVVIPGLLARLGIEP